LEKEFAH